MKRFKYFIRKFKYNRKRSTIVGALVLLCLSLTLGFAYLTTELNINGTLNIASSRWDIHFENIEISPNSVTATTNPTISNDTTITFATTLEKPGDFYEFTTDIVNDGTYDAKIDSIAISPTLTSEEQEFFEYKIEYTDGGTVQVDDALDAGTSENIRVLFKYKENYDSSKYPEEDTDFTVEVTITYVQGTGNPVQHTSLYSVLKTAAKDGTYAKEYTGAHQDSMAGVGSKKIYHWYAPRTSSGNAQGNQIADMNNVIFAGQCWKMMRTTDTGGVKMIYNGVPTDGKCTSSTITIGSAKISPSNVGGYPGYTSGGQVTTNTIYSSTLAHSSVGYMNKDKYLFSDSTDEDNIAYLPIGQFGVFSEDDVISFGPTADPNDAPAGSVLENVAYDPEGYYGNDYYYETLEGLYIYDGTNFPSDDGPFYVIYVDNTSDETAIYTISLGNNAIDPNMEIILGESYTYSNGVYTLQDTQRPTFYDWYHNHLDWEAGDYYTGYYTCEGENIVGGLDTCTDISFITSTTKDGFRYLSSKNEYLFASGFTYNSTTNEYTLNSDRVRYWSKSLTTDESLLNTHHYTCLNEPGSVTCKYLSYVTSKNDYNIFFILLKDGDSIEDALDDTIFASDINSNDSPIKAMIDTWFSNNIANTSYANQLEDVVFCNNRKVISSGALKPDGGVVGERLHFGNYVETYGDDRSALNDLSCPDVEDMFSVNNSQAHLTYPVALPTAPEFEIVGNLYALCLNSSSHWTMTPCSLGNSFGVYKTGLQPVSCGGTASNVSDGGGVRPVISLKQGTKYASGDGSKANPYYIDMNRTVFLTDYDPTNAVAYSSYQEAIAASGYPFFIQNVVDGGGNVIESNVGFIMNDELYYLRGGVDETSSDTHPVYDSNKETLQNAFGSSNCSENVSDNYLNYHCSISDLSAGTSNSGYSTSGLSGGYRCYINSNGSSSCNNLQ